MFLICVNEQISAYPLIIRDIVFPVFVWLSFRALTADTQPNMLSPCSVSE